MQKQLGQASSPPWRLTLDRATDLPLYLQISQRFKSAIENGHLRAGHRVPAVRALAIELGIARGTVDMAYRLLTDEGYLQSRGAAGTVVSSTLYRSPPAPSPPPCAPRVRTSPYDGKPPKALQLGLPGLDVFPRKVWNRLVGQRLRTSDITSLAYPHPAGHETLRERIATYLGVSRGVDCLPEQVMVTTGFRASLALIFDSLASPSDTCWFEDPGYILARPFLHGAGLNVVPVPVDTEGLDVDAAIRRAPRARFALLTPSHQSPLGVALTLPRRMALLQWAAREQSWIIEDDYDSEFRFQGRPLPALKSLDRDDRVIYSGTFSKVMFPGLRLAYIVVPRSLVARFEAASGRLNGGCPQLLQTAVADFIAQGHFYRHLKKMRLLYAARRQMTQQVFNHVLSEHLHITLPPGGLHILADLVEDCDDVAMGEKAWMAGLAAQPLSPWYIQAPARRGLLMGYANIMNERQAMDIAVRLRQAIHMI